MIKTLPLFILLLFQQCFAQDRNSIWCFGDSAGIDFTNTSNPQPIFTGMDGRGSCVSIADTAGSLLFYAFCNNYSRTIVMDVSNDTMQNADPMQGYNFYNDLVIIPKPGASNLYYLFNVGVPGFVDTVYYALIDMNLNSGLGAVIQKNVSFDQYSAADCLTSIKHGNGRDWWIINKLGHLTTNTNQYYVYLIDSLGISPRISPNFNDAHDITFQKIVWNSMGSRFIQINFRGYMAEYAFDRCTGIITQLRTVYTETSNGSGRFFWEGAYSPNDSLFYVSTSGTSVNDTLYLLQYNLMAANVPASSDTLDSFSISTSGISTGAVRLAPDGKIYFSRAYESMSVLNYPYPDNMRNYINENLSVINQPNNLGAACDYQPFSFYLAGKRTYYGLPNNPNYSLGPLAGSPCDTLTTTIEVADNTATVFLSPNPASRTIYFNAQRVKGKRATLRIVNSLGERIYEKIIDVYSGGYATQRIDVSDFSNGIYFVSLQTEKEVVSGKFVKE